jgi:hypothetical protein
MRLPRPFRPFRLLTFRHLPPLNLQFAGYSTVTDLARFRGWSTLQPRLTAT